MRKEIYELLEAINRADSLGEAYESAMQFISSALKCSKVSILLLDESGVMRERVMILRLSFISPQGRYRKVG